MLSCVCRADPRYEPPKVKYEQAKVVEAERIDIDDAPEAQFKEKHQRVTLKILSGKLKGNTISFDHVASGGLFNAGMNIGRDVNGTGG